MTTAYQHVEIPPITPEAGQPVPVRYEIRELLENADYASLCLRAYHHFQNIVLRENVCSWYEIGGIHGCPFREWDRVPRYAKGYQGYCPHGSFLFLPWHRAWESLFERTLQQSAQQVVDAFGRSDRQEEREFGERLSKLLPTFAVPYWDWAQMLPSGADSVPEIFRMRRVQIPAPGPPGTKEEVHNPFYMFNFREVKESEFPNKDHGFSIFLNTVRYPHASSGSFDPHDVGQPDTLEQTIAMEKDSIRRQVYHLLTDQQYADYATFSTQLESIHGHLHDIIGGGGHMSDVDYACFDPIFSFHHGYIDFLFTVWQRLYPDGDMGDATHFNTSKYGHGFYDGKQSVLPPFHQTQDTLLNNMTVWKARDFGSNYLALDQDPSPDEMREIIRVLYSEASAQSRLLNDYPNLIKEDNTATEYFATVSAKHYALGRSFLVRLFMARESVEDDYDVQNFVGTFAVFSNNPITTGCEKCKVKEIDNKIDSVRIPLTVALLERLGDSGDDNTLHPDNIGPYLRKSLRWKISLANGEPVDSADVPSLSIEISTSEVTLGKLDRDSGRKGPGGPRLPEKFPEYEPAKRLFDLTGAA